MRQNKIQNIVVHNSSLNSHFCRESLDDFSVSVIKRCLIDMPVNSLDKMEIVDEIIKLLKSESL